ncbi:MAG: hypothetical protein IPM80_00005 [Proteobacteria bacterium]|nr:hypothetical protein [Pseudomonadota bacterium]
MASRTRSLAATGLDLSPDDVHWNISDTGWAKAAYSSYFGPWNMGATVFVHHSPVFDAKKTPRSARALSHHCHPVRRADGVSHGGAAGPVGLQVSAPASLCGRRRDAQPEVIETWKRATGLVIRDGYGQTETMLVCGNHPSITPRFGSMGQTHAGRRDGHHR